RWICRGLWIAAWTFWVWLGFGLYRELPRDLGPVVYEPRFEPGEQLQGFLRDQPAFMTKVNDTAVFRLHNARTGEIESTMRDDGETPASWEWVAWSWHGLAIGHQRMKLLQGTTPETMGYRPDGGAGDVRVLNLRTGERRSFVGLGMLLRVHPDYPWGLF